MGMAFNSDPVLWGLGSASFGMQVTCGKSFCIPNLDISPFSLLRQLLFYAQQYFPVKKLHIPTSFATMDGQHPRVFSHQPELVR